LPINVKLDDKVRLPRKKLFDANELTPIVVTVSGIVNDPLKLEHDKNALLPIVVIPELMTNVQPDAIPELIN